MDYKKYYVKNYFGKTNTPKIKYPKEQNILVERDKYYREQNTKEEKSKYYKEQNNDYYNIADNYVDYEEYTPPIAREKAISPQIIYLTAPASNSTYKQEINYDYEAVPTEQLKKEKVEQVRIVKQKSKTKGASIVILLVVIVFLSSFVASDYITKGLVINTITTWIAGEPIDYYAVSLGAFNDYEEAMTESISVRERGGSGYIMGYNNMFCVLGDIYDNESDATAVADKQIYGKIIKISIPKLKIPKEKDKEIKKEIQTYCYYNITQSNMLKDFVTKIAKLEMDDNSLKQQLIKAKAEQEDSLRVLEKSQFVGNSKIKSIVVDMTVCIGLLDNLISDSKDRYNSTCDLRYYAIQMILNQQALITSLNK